MFFSSNSKFTPKPLSKTTPQAGFSLLELAIVLTVLGLIGSFSLPLLMAHMKRTALLKTKENQAYAVTAIAAFVEKNHRFPCPAIPAGKGSSFGVEQIPCRGDRAVGILPFRSLGISEQSARDGFKEFMVYGVEQELAKKMTALEKEQGGYLIVKNEEGNSVLASPHKANKNPNYVAFVLIGYGEKDDKILPVFKKREQGGFEFNENPQTKAILRWESRDQFLKHYVRVH